MQIIERLKWSLLILTTCFHCDVENNDEDPKSKVGHMWEYQNIKEHFCKTLRIKLVRTCIWDSKT